MENWLERWTLRLIDMGCTNNCMMLRLVDLHGKGWAALGLAFRRWDDHSTPKSYFPLCSSFEVTVSLSNCLSYKFRCAFVIEGSAFQHALIHFVRSTTPTDSRWLYIYTVNCGEWENSIFPKIPTILQAAKPFRLVDPKYFPTFH